MLAALDYLNKMSCEQQEARIVSPMQCKGRICNCLLEELKVKSCDINNV